MIWIRVASALLLFLAPAASTAIWVSDAGDRLEDASADRDDGPGVAVAAAANEDYCTGDLKRVLRRVLKSCGLLEQGGTAARGCQPLDAKQVATMAGDDFNALFLPMKERGGIIQFERGDAELDAADTALADQVFAAQGGASYFFIVARASPDGSVERNRELSKERAEALMEHLRTTFDDPDLEREVGLLWLGEEFAQLDESFCSWQRSGASEECVPEDINRSAFVAWIDCRL